MDRNDSRIKRTAKTREANVADEIAGEIQGTLRSDLPAIGSIASGATAEGVSGLPSLVDPYKSR